MSLASDFASWRTSSEPSLFLAELLEDEAHTAIATQVSIITKADIMGLETRMVGLVDYFDAD